MKNDFFWDIEASKLSLMAGIQAGDGGDTAHTALIQGIFWHGRPTAELRDSVALVAVLIIFSAVSVALGVALGGR